MGMNKTAISPSCSCHHHVTHSSDNVFFYKHVRPELLTKSCCGAEHFKCRNTASLSGKVLYWEVLKCSFWSMSLRRVTMVKADLQNDNIIL